MADQTKKTYKNFTHTDRPRRVNVTVLATDLKEFIADTPQNHNFKNTTALLCSFWIWDADLMDKSRAHTAVWNILNAAGEVPHLDTGRTLFLHKVTTHTQPLIHCFSLSGTPALLSRRVIMDTHSIRSLLPFHSCLSSIYSPCFFPPLTQFVRFSLYIHVRCPGRAHESASRSLSP